jgi:F0F1-type ATP synthase assembly protein I
MLKEARKTKLRKIQLILAAMTALIIVAYSSSVYAADVAPSESTLAIAEAFQKIASVVVPAIVVALVTSGLGYLKSNTPDTFDPAKLIATLIIAFIVGVGTSLYGLNYTEVTTYLTNGGLTVYIYWFAQWIAAKIGFKVVAKPKEG